jgi:hypothetical protein
MRRVLPCIAASACPIQWQYLPIEARVHGKSGHTVGDMSNVSEHTTAHRASGADRKVGKRTVESAKPQPGFRR